VPTGAVVGRSTVAQISNGTAKANTLPNATVADFAPGHSVVRRLVLVGAPIDIAAAESQLSRFVADVPLGMFDELVRQIQKSSDHRSLQQSGFTKSRSDHHSFYAPIRHSLVGFPRTRNGSVCVEQYNRR
jgi:hypothetical protein